MLTGIELINMESKKVDDDESTVEIPLNEISLDESISTAVIKNGGVFLYDIYDRSIPLIPLTQSRLESLLSANLDCIERVRLLFNNTIKKYEIVDGRHRITTAILQGRTSIRIENPHLVIDTFVCDGCRMIDTTKNKTKEGETLCLKCFTNECCPICKVWEGDNSVCEKECRPRKKRRTD